MSLINKLNMSERPITQATAWQQQTVKYRQPWGKYLLLFILLLVLMLGGVFLLLSFSHPLSSPLSPSSRLKNPEAVDLTAIQTAERTGRHLAGENVVLPIVLAVKSFPSLQTEPLPIHGGDYHPEVKHPVTEQNSETKRRGQVSSSADEPYIYQDQQSIEKSDQFNLNNLDYSELSPELAAQVRKAMSNSDTDVEEDLVVKPISQLSEDTKAQLPSLNLQTHLYASDVDNRWVKVNGVERQQGDVIASGVILERIEPRQVIIRFQGELISMEALSEWQSY
ncbi:general secretion pathway protein GspB [Vibrio sp. SS-MA-C1-2]|uniref:general secretion pathway protein GspB n=1 Tax=Vibrio sp. SS-MA-C1-2 TaxID=2908646 RepID=UPI001F3F18DC|nr:general secretion pathway protein GspB [Vibrio sp. SS-MA-C1-2]UJF19112.1 general secretion pathway protein GspB [Vibrio sp. SS-MA-C1-2]